MRILVLGACGTTGRALCAELAARGHSIVRVDCQDALEVDATTDLRNEEDVFDLIQRHTPDWIFNVTGSYTNDFLTDLSSNVVITHNILKGVADLDYNPKVLLVGSVAEYGPRVRPTFLTEKSPTYPTTPYGYTKLCQTHLAQMYHRKHGVRVCIARTSNLFAYDMSPQLVLGKVASAAKEFTGHPIEVGSLAAYRDYIQVEEAVRAYYHIMCTGSSGRVYNVASGVNTLVRDAVHKVLDHYKVAHEALHEAPALHPEAELHYDTRALCAIGYQPQVKGIT